MGDINTASGPQRQQFGSTREKYAMLFSLTCTSYYVKSFWIYSFRYSILPWLIAYSVMQLFIGIPMFLMEYFIGQFSSSSIINMYEVAPALKGTGLTSLFLIMIWMCSAIHDSGKELVTLAYTFTMPWTDCGNWWNTDKCQTESTLSMSNGSMNVSDYSYEDPFNYEMNVKYEKPSEEFFKMILHGMNLSFLWYVLLAAVIIWILVYFVAVSGTRSLGKVAMVSTVFHFAVTVVLLVVGLATTIPYGGEMGLEYYLYPSFHHLSIYDIWLDAIKVIMVHQLVGTGIRTTFGSYDKVTNNCLVDAIIVAVFNFMYPFVHGIIAAAFTGFLSVKMGDDIMDNVYNEGTMLWALSIIPGHFIWVFLYVLMKFVGKFVYCAILLESILTSLSDAYPKHFKNRKIVALGVCLPLILFSLIFCIGNYNGYQAWLFVDYYLLGKGFWGNMSWFIFVFVYLYGAGRLVRDIRHFLPGISWAVNWPCYLSWIVIISIAYTIENIRMYGFGSVAVVGVGVGGSWNTARLGDFIVSSVLWFTIIYAIVYIIRTKGTFVQRLATGFRPSAAWGPHESEVKLAWEEYSKKRPMCCGCSHPDCCTTRASNVSDDVGIPLRVEMSGDPGQPSLVPNESYPLQPTTEKPGTTIETGLYPNLPAGS